MKKLREERAAVVSWKSAFSVSVRLAKTCGRGVRL